MTRWWRSHSVRVRLTLWYVGAMVVVLAVYAAVVFAFVSRNASEALDSRLRGDFQWAAAMVDQTPEGGITWYERTSSTEEELPWLQVWSADGAAAYQNVEAAAPAAAGEPGDIARRADDSRRRRRGRPDAPVRVLTPARPRSAASRS